MADTHAGAAFSEGFCPDCRTPLGSRDDPGIARSFCQKCRRYWTRRGEMIEGRAANSGTHWFLEFPDGTSSMEYVPEDVVMHCV